MGQYYHPTNLEKKQWIYAHDYDCGLKLMEHSYIGNHIMNAVENMIIPGGAWYKNKLVWAGDYADPEPEHVRKIYKVTLENINEISAMTPEEAKEKFLEDLTDLGDCLEVEILKDDPEDENKNIYSLMREDENKVNPPIKKVPSKYHFLTNHTKKQVVDLSKIKKDKDGFRIHPLSLLICEGNGRGGGDFRKEDSRIGLWARDSISLEDSILIDFLLIDGQFEE